MHSLGLSFSGVTFQPLSMARVAILIVSRPRNRGQPAAWYHLESKVEQKIVPKKRAAHFNPHYPKPWDAEPLSEVSVSFQHWGRKDDLVDLQMNHAQLPQDYLETFVGSLRSSRTSLEPFNPSFSVYFALVSWMLHYMFTIEGSQNCIISSKFRLHQHPLHSQAKIASTQS